MFSGELKAAAAKLQREQAERGERERQRLAKERALAERQRRRQAEREEAARARRLEAAAAAAAEEERHQQDLEENRGVSLRVRLAAAPASAEGGPAARGIRRAEDKLVLPASVGDSLMAQDAPKNGAMLFEVAASNGGSTHAGVLEFTAPEGVVLLPPKVADCLWGPGGGGGGGGGDGSAPRAGSPSAPAGPASGSGRCSGQVWVRYKRLPKGSYVRFQPELRAFHDEVGADPEAMRSALEACLLGYCTLSEGDWVRVAWEGRAYNLRVLELAPAPAVSVIDTEMAADVGPSIETEGYLRAAEEAEARQAERRRQQAEAAEQEAAQALAAEEAAYAAEQQRAAEEAARRLQVQAEKEALVAPEPPPEAPSAVVLLFRLPDGSRLSRRFGLGQRVQELYDFVDAKGGGGGLWPDTYQLVQQFPRRVLPPGGAATLEEVGLEAGQQQALFAEALAEQPGGRGA